ncbi:MAG: asparagine synthase (glutamine-hydrolyzing) [Sandaracinaceae bacterium]
MCGLTGLWEGGGTADPERTASALLAMREALRPRGPDDAGVWSDGGAGLHLGHRRLAILDRSTAARQPMVSRSGRYVLAYNGEVYNFRALRTALEGPWRTDGDTEVVLAAVEQLGLRSALPRFVGMFAFALWDREERRLTLVRDRLGIKPLVYGRQGRRLLFGSTLAALEAHPAFDAPIDRSAVASYLRFNCVPAPHTVYEGCRKVRPGTWVRFTSPLAEGDEVVWWDPGEGRATARPCSGTLPEAADRLEAALLDAVRDRLVADVPLGAFLSGGIDSSTVVALMAAAAGGRVRTFAIGNERADYDESASARAVAAHLGTDHTELVVGAEQALSVVPRIPRIADEPFADSSLIPTFLVSELARGHVTVALSGDGGDELFGGYNRHFWGPAVWRGLHAVPVPIRRVAARGIGQLSADAWDALLTARGRLPAPVRLPGDKLHKLAGVLDAPDADRFYLGLQSHLTRPSAMLATPGVVEAERPAPRHRPASLAERMMLGDLVGYLPDDILTKVDRASMAVSLEARVPLLDHRVLELSWQLPTVHKVRGTVGKRVLREVLARHVPRRLWERPKMGFGVPIGDWLRGPLAPWARELLSPRRLRDGGVFDPGAVLALWEQHRSGHGDRAHQLWDVLMFEAWREARSR